MLLVKHIFIRHRAWIRILVAAVMELYSQTGHSCLVKQASASLLGDQRGGWSQFGG